MKSIINSIFMNILFLLPKNAAHRILFRKRMGYNLNLNNPVDLNEKIQWLILKEYGIKEANLTDKFMVKKLLKNMDSNLIIPKLYYVYDSVDDIDLDLLPKQFVLKTNNGCGNVFVCKNKNEFDLYNAKINLKKALKSNFSKKALEYHYSFIKPKIICEELLLDNNEIPNDYKFYCFNGNVSCVLVCSERVNENNKMVNYYDMDWNELDYVKSSYRNDKKINKPKNFDKMKEIASLLSRGHKFVRVDLYNISGKIYFGELTFTPACGMIYNLKKQALIDLGSNLNLER